MPQVVAFAVTALIPAAADTAVTIAVGSAVAEISYAAIIGYAVTIGGAIAYGQNQAAQLRNSLKNTGADQGRTVMSRDPIAYRRAIYGQVPVTGGIPFMATTGTKNELLHVIVMIAGHECEELGTIYFDNFEEVPLDGSGNATGKYAGYFVCKKHLGTVDQAADTDLIAAAPALWTSAHKLSGRAYLYCQFTYNANLFPNGLPLVRCLTKGKKLLDPRVGIADVACNIDAASRNIGAATTGLSVGMRVISKELLPDTRITFLDPGGTYFSINTDPLVTNATATCTAGVDAWSDTAALCCADMLNDSTWGKGIPWARIDQTGLAAEANICEEVITLVTGTEIRYAINGTATSDQSPDTIMLDMVSSMAGKVTETGGTWGVLAGAYRSPGAHTFVDDDLCGAFNLQPRQSMRDTFSGVKGTFYSPDNAWVPTDFVPQKNDTYLGYDGGVRRWKDIAFGFVTSSYQAQRLAKIELERGRLQKTFTAPYKLGAFALQVGDTMPLTRAVLGYTDKPFEVAAWEFAVNDSADGKYLSVNVTARETASGVYDWDDGSETVVDLAPQSSLPDPSSVPTPSLNTPTSDSWVQSGGDGTFIPRVKLTWATPNNIYVETGDGKARIEYKKHADTDWIVWDTVRGDILVAYVTDVQVGTAYDFRVQWQNQVGVRGAYSTQSNYTVTKDTTAPATPSGLAFVTGTGKSVSLAWTNNSESDLDEYQIYRSTDNVTFAAIGKVSANRFVDVNVALGTGYYYEITALDFSGNESSRTSSVGPATPGTIGAGSVDSTPPSDPAAPTLSSSGTRLAGDGTVLAFFVVGVPAMPSGGVIMNILYRKAGAAGWIMGNQVSAGGGTSNIDDLTPGTNYDLGVQAFSVFGHGSNIVTLLSQSSPNQTTIGDPSGGSLTAPTSGQIPALTTTVANTFAWGCLVQFTSPSNTDLDHFELKATFTDSDAATDYLWFAYQAPAGLAKIPAAGASAVISVPIYEYATSPGQGYVRVRAVNTSGQASNWLKIGDFAANHCIASAKDMSSQASSGVAITGGTSVTSTEQTASLKVAATAGASSIRQVLTHYEKGNASATLSGGSPTESVNLDISNRGFSASPSSGIINVQSSTIGAYFDQTNVGNSSSNAVIKFYTFDGTNLPAGTVNFFAAINQIF